MAIFETLSNCIGAHSAAKQFNVSFYRTADSNTRLYDYSRPRSVGRIHNVGFGAMQSCHCTILPYSLGLALGTLPPDTVDITNYANQARLKQMYTFPLLLVKRQKMLNTPHALSLQRQKHQATYKSKITLSSNLKNPLPPQTTVSRALPAPPATPSNR